MPTSCCGPLAAPSTLHARSPREGEISQSRKQMQLPRLAGIREFPPRCSISRRAGAGARHQVQLVGNAHALPFYLDPCPAPALTSRRAAAPRCNKLLCDVTPAPPPPAPRCPRPRRGGGSRGGLPRPRGLPGSWSSAVCKLGADPCDPELGVQSRRGYNIPPPMHPSHKALQSSSPTRLCGCAVPLMGSTCAPRPWFSH